MALRLLEDISKHPETQSLTAPRSFPSERRLEFTPFGNMYCSELWATTLDKFLRTPSNVTARTLCRDCPDGGGPSSFWDSCWGHLPIGHVRALHLFDIQDTHYAK